MRRRQTALLAAVLCIGACVGGEPRGEPSETRYAELTSRLVGVTQIASGAFHNCARLESGRVACWGSGVNGNSSEPGDVPGLADVESVSAGDKYTCAVRSDKRVVCWGLGDHGVLGEGIDQSETPVVISFSGLTGTLAVSAGWHTACALQSDHTVDCWGAGTGGQLGDGAFADSSVPVTVSGLSDAKAVAVGDEHACAIRESGSVVCWGDGSLGSLGTGNRDDSGVPVAVSDIEDAVSIAAGEHHTCVVRANHQVACWGFGGYGQIGNGIYDTALIPETVSAITDAVSVAAGGAHTCAVRSNQQVLCWGNNEVGQLGDGSRNFSSVPIVASGSFDAVSAGADHTCAIRLPEVACWGHGIHGELGNGIVGSSLLPVAVLGGRALGQACEDDSTCDSGRCVDGVCCSSACGGSVADDCQACSRGAGGSINGECRAVSAGALCADDGRGCTRDFCDGTIAVCRHMIIGAGTPCHLSRGACDPVEVCNGASPDCPDDTLTAAGTACASDGNACTVDRCDGASADCQHPAGNAGTICETAACETPATCSGSSSVCPATTPIPACTAQTADEGTNVALPFNGGLSAVGGMLIIASNVTAPGDVTVVEKNTDPPPLGEFGTVPSNPPLNWEINTTAGITPPITVCVVYGQDWFADYDPSNPTKNECTAGGLMEDECNVVLVHYHTSDSGYDTLDPPPPEVGLALRDFDTNTVCGKTNSLSPFALAVPLDKAGPVFDPLPADIRVFATSTRGALVNYPTPTAVDAFDGPTSVTCTAASGSQFPPGKTPVTCTTADSRGNTSTASFAVWVQFQAPTEGTFFLDPINANGSSIFKKGSTVPVKFRLQGASAGIKNLVAHLAVAKVSNGVTGTFLEATSTSAADAGDVFRFDPSSNQYIFNLATKSLSTGTWSLRADLGDEVTHQIDVSLR